jgi:hypothetical protein
MPWIKETVSFSMEVSGDVDVFIHLMNTENWNDYGSMSKTNMMVWLEDETIPAPADAFVVRIDLNIDDHSDSTDVDVEAWAVRWMDIHSERIGELAEESECLIEEGPSLLEKDV